MDLSSVKRKCWLLRCDDSTSSAPPTKTKRRLSSIATCCKRKCSVCVWLLFLGFFVCTNIFHMMDMKYISVSINSLIYIEFMENDSSSFDNETFAGNNVSSTTLHALPPSQITLNKEASRTKFSENLTKNASQKQVRRNPVLPDSSAPFVLRCDVLNVDVTSVPSPKESHASSESAEGDNSWTANVWAFFRRKRRNNIHIQFSASTTLPPKKHFFVRNALLPPRDSTATSAISETPRTPAKKPFNFLRISFNKTFNGSAVSYSQNIRTRTVQFNPIEMKRCLKSSISSDNRCFWDGVETNAFFIDEAVQENVSDTTISNGRTVIRHEFTGVTLWNVLHRLQSCDMADYVMNSIIEDSTAMNGEKASFVSFHGPSFDNSSVLLDAGYYRSYEHTSTPICKYSSTMLIHTFEQFLSRQREYRRQSLTLETSLAHLDDHARVPSSSSDESILESVSRLDDSSLDRDDILLNGTETIPDESFPSFASNATSHRWLVAYIIVQYLPIESSYDPILVPVSTPRFTLHSNELSLRYNRHVHPPKTNVLGFDHIYQNICATAISMPLDGSTNDSASVFHTALAMQDCFDSIIWNQYKGSIVSCRYSILNDTDNDDSNNNSPDDSVNCRHTLERTMQDFLAQNRSV